MERIKEIISNTQTQFDFKLLYMIHPFYDKDGNINGGVFKFYNADDRSLVTQFILQQMSGCNGIVISRGVNISTENRGKGYGGIFCELRENLCKQFGYTMILCTVVLTNAPQVRIMEKRGWQVLQKFINSRTNNEVCLYCKTL